MKENKENKLNEVIPFARLGNSSEPPKVNYLREMENGTRFLVSRNGMDDSRLLDFVVASDPKGMAAVFLCENNGHGGEFKFVDPVKFVKQYDLFTILEVLRQENGDNNQVQEGRVERDAQPEERQGVHGEEQ